MARSRAALRKMLIELLREDEEFRLVAAGYLGIDETLKAIKATQEELARLREDLLAAFNKHDEELARHSEEMARLREDFNKLHAEFNRKAEEDSKRFASIEAELARLREDFNRKAEEDSKRFASIEAELAQLRRDMVEGFKRHDEEIAQLRRDMVEGFKLLERHISALGARWGVMSEEAFRQGLKGLLEKSFNVKIERWRDYDSEGLVFRRPSEIEVDVAVRDGQVILMEISSHVRRSDVYNFKNKADFYAKRTGTRPSRLIMVTPYADEDALRAAVELGVEMYTGV
ncbi:MAG: DUF3782 domain-containing protein [Infirmifilum sp.]